jgi:putative membrane-bound dehydrogenase-like protein
MLLIGFLLACAQDSGAPDPETARAALVPADGFEAACVAWEPDVVDPIALAFDEKGRLWVVEMPGYPNGGLAESPPRAPGRVKILDDFRDGRYRKVTVFASGLDFPTSVLPYRRGAIVAAAPDVLYFEDTDGDGRADRRRVLYTGFGRKNIQALVNGLLWGIDNWVHGLGAGNGGEILCPERPDRPPVSLGGRAFRFRPDEPGRFEAESGLGGQYGLAEDDTGRRFTCANPAHLKEIVLPDRYLARAPYVSAPPALVDIPEHGAAARLYRLSPFETWRVERTRRRAGSADASRFAKTELVPGGYVTSASGLTVYRGDLFPEPYRGNVFVCDPANNVVHRDVLVPEGVRHRARRAEEEKEREFLASRDIWFRPVFLASGPDGALYVADFAREVIETPLSLPDDLKASLNLESRGAGRIWRVAPRGAAAGSAPRLDAASDEELARTLAHPNAWRRLTAQRLLVQDRRRGAVPAVRALLAARDPLARLHALWTLDGLGALEAPDVERALQDPAPRVREHAVRLAEGRLAHAAPLAPLADDPDPRVRSQLAFTLGEDRRPGWKEPLVRLLARETDPYLRTAALSSVGEEPLEFARALPGDAPAGADLARLIGLRRLEAEIAGLLALIDERGPDAARAARLRALAQGLRQRSPRPIDVPSARDPLARLLGRADEEVRAAAREVAALARTAGEAERAAEREKALETAFDPDRPERERVEAIRLLAPSPPAARLAELLDPRHPEAVQRAAIEALDALPGTDVVEASAARWRKLTPAVRERALAAAFARKERLGPLLGAIERGDIPADSLDPARRSELLGFPDAALAARARTALARLEPDPGRFEAFRGALDLRGDAARGAATFRKLCISCHAVGSEGVAIGPNLVSVRDNPPEQILRNIVEPNLVVLPNYVPYVVETRDGRILSGVLAASTAGSITLRRPGAEDATVYRKDIVNFSAGRLSPMPEDLLKGLSLQDVADLLEYVRQIR